MCEERFYATCWEKTIFRFLFSLQCYTLGLAKSRVFAPEAHFLWQILYWINRGLNPYRDWSFPMFSVVMADQIPGFSQDPEQGSKLFPQPIMFLDCDGSPGVVLQTLARKGHLFCLTLAHWDVGGLETLPGIRAIYMTRKCALARGKQTHHRLILGKFMLLLAFKKWKCWTYISLWLLSGSPLGA